MRTHAASVSAPAPWLPGVLQRKCSSCGSTASASPCKTCSEENHDDSAALPLQRRSSNTATAPTSAPASVQRTLAEPGQSLQPVLRQQMEQRFGQDFSQVRVHADGGAAASAAEVSAQAYTVGRHVVFGQGRFQPHSREGRGLLAHELTHVVQQRSATPGLLRYAPRQNNDAPAEREAEHNAARIDQRDRLSVNVRVHGAAPLHRRVLKEEPAAGCGYCHGNAALAGMRAHKELQTEWVLPTLLGLIGVPKLAEVPLTCRGKRKRPDLVLRPSANQWIIGSIKPARARYYSDGENVFRTYARCIKDGHPGASVMALREKLPKSVSMMPFPNPTASRCRDQHLYVNDPDTWGVYGYYCSPTRREELARNPHCKCRKRKDSKRKRRRKARAAKQKVGKTAAAPKTAPKTATTAKPKPKSGGGAYNIGFGLSLFSLSGGVGNAGVGISVFSTSTGFGTAGIGISILSDTLGIGSLGAGATAGSQNAAALSASGGLDTRSSNEGALSLGLGSGDRNRNSGLAAVSEGSASGNEIEAKNAASSGDIVDSTIRGEGSGSGKLENADGEGRAGEKPAEAGDGEHKPGDGQGTQTAAKPAQDGGTAGPPADAAAAATARAEFKGRIEAELALVAPDSTPQQRSLAAEQVLRLRELLRSAAPPQQELLRRLAQQRAGYYPMPTLDWAERLLKATAGISQDDIDYLLSLDWEPGSASADELRQRLERLLKSRRPAAAGAAPAKPGTAAKPGAASKPEASGSGQKPAAAGADKGTGGQGKKGGDKRGDRGKGDSEADTAAASGGGKIARGFTEATVYEGPTAGPQPFGLETKGVRISADTQPGTKIELVVTFLGSDKKTHRHKMEFVVSERVETDRQVEFTLTTTNAKQLNIAPAGLTEFAIPPGTTTQVVVKR